MSLPPVFSFIESYLSTANIPEVDGFSGGI
jgi:hypothetical protein